MLHEIVLRNFISNCRFCTSNERKVIKLLKNIVLGNYCKNKRDTISSKKRDVEPNSKPVSKSPMLQRNEPINAKPYDECFEIPLCKVIVTIRTKATSFSMVIRNTLLRNINMDLRAIIAMYVELE